MKTLFAVFFTGLILFAPPPAAAAPLEISGDATIKYESDTADNTPTESGTMFSITLRGEQKIGHNLSLFARLGAQYASNPILGDFNPSFYGQNTKFAVAIDQFGLIYKPKNLTFTLGRQEASVGTTALLYSRSETNIGSNAFVDGLSVNGSIGSIDISAIAAKENNLWLSNNSLYALRGGYNLSPNVNMGFTWAQYNYYEADTTRHWAVDASVKFGKSNVIAEYAKSNNSTDNKAYAVTWNYAFDGKTALYITNFRVEANADMGGQSDFDNNNRGFYYGVTHSLNDNLSLEVIYKNQVLLADDSKNAKLEIWLKNKF